MGAVPHRYAQAAADRTLPRVVTGGDQQRGRGAGPHPEHRQELRGGPGHYISRGACRIRRCADRCIREGTLRWLSSRGGAPRGAD